MKRNRTASISARFSDILRENYPHFCGNLSHLRISSLYILPYTQKNCNSFLNFFLFLFVEITEFYLVKFVHFKQNHPQKSMI